MNLRFRQWLAEGPMDDFLKMRATTMGPANQADVTRWSSTTSGANQPVSKLPPNVLSQIQTGFQQGSIVPDNLVRMLDLQGKRYSLVADNTMTALPTGAYPFVRQKLSGRPTGKISFVRGFPISKALALLDKAV